MKIAIDVRTACSRKAGKGVYTYELVRQILRLDRTNEYILYTDKICADFAAFHHAHIKVIHARPWAWHFAVIKDWTRREKGDVFFAPTSFIIPALLPKKYASVVTVHDIVAFLHPHLHQAKATILEHLFIKLALKKARYIIAPSQNTKDDVVRYLKFDSPKKEESKIAVTHLAADPVFFDKAKNLDEVRKKYNLPERFILTVGGLEPRKNIGELLDAYEKVAEKLGEKITGCPLVIVGGKGWKSEHLQKRIAKSAQENQKDSERTHQIIHLDNVVFGDLPAIYQLAMIFVFPSLYEGFGLPPLEAMASGTPVICSTAGSLKEVVGENALLFSPGDTQKLADQLEHLLRDESARKHLAEIGKTQGQKFSWERTAEETLKVFSKCK